ncbi:large ribosomal subunit protein mL65-like [Tubulanus polymorphus]|uniref:large ribosomal subunit protein mL65-like n=1 Tax=Tubulanus polymorphus TaxID=672921 RepID=UPI003DA2E093
MALLKIGRFLTNKTSPGRLIRRFAHQNSALLSADPSEYTDEPEYPAIKPRYPPGKWENWTEKDAWEYWLAGDQLSEIPTLHEKFHRVVSLDKEKATWRVRPLEKVPRILPYQQHVTKSKIISDLPKIYDNVVGFDAELLETVKPLVRRMILQENILSDRENRDEDDDGIIRRKYCSDTLKSIIGALRATLAGKYEHVLRSHVDEDAKIESFWKVGGYSKKGDDEIDECRGRNNLGLLRMQFSDRADLLIRGETPLPPFFDINDSLCIGEEPQYKFTPSALGQFASNTSPSICAGYLTKNQFIEGDPCEFGYLACLNSSRDLSQTRSVNVANLDDDQLSQWDLGYGMLTCFSWALAQAYNQGFSYLNELTSPFSSQAIVADGRKITFVAYQLNTVQLWKENVNNPLRNLCWHTPQMNLYEKIENGEVVGLNDEAISLILKFLLMKPVLRENMRPYLSEASPLSVDAYMNLKDEPKIERPHPPRLYAEKKEISFHDLDPLTKTAALMDRVYKEYEKKWDPVKQKWK